MAWTGGRTLPETAERRPLHTDGALETTTSPGTTIPDLAVIAAELERSDERDRWVRVALTREGDAYRQGYAAGRRDGYRAGREDADREWMAALEPARSAARRAAAGPSFAELEARRWGLGGRAHFADPRPGDRPGRSEAA